MFVITCEHGGEGTLGPTMTYHLQFLRGDGSPACFYMTQCGSDEQAKAIAATVLNAHNWGVEILRGEKLIFQQPRSKPH